MTRSRSAPPTRRPSANLSPAQIRAAIRLLEARIAELKALPVETVSFRDDPRVLALQSKVAGTLDQIYGVGTTEYHRLRDATDLDTTSYHMTVQLGSYFGNGGHRGGGTPALEIQQGIERGRQRAIALLTGEVALMKEQLGGDGGNPTDRAIRAYSNLDLHPEIGRSASALYQDGHYANAIEDAVKALNGLVRMRSGETLDGTALMQRVFLPKNPVLRFNDLNDQDR